MQHKIIIGLGNPTDEYKNTRHNIGFEVIDTLATKYKVKLKSEKNFQCDYGKENVQINGNDYCLILARPTTYMNNSGNAVIKLFNWFKLNHSDLIVIHDEVAINLGKIRVGFENGAGGHHGIESIIESLGGVKGFNRIRVGIGPDPGGDIRAEYVLAKFPKSEEGLVTKVINLSIEAVETIISKGYTEAMNRYNGIEISL